MNTPFDKDSISEEKYRSMLLYEEQLRKSNFIQTMFQIKNTDDTIILLVQKTTLIHFGYRAEDEDVRNYQDCIQRFDRSNFPVYWIKYNISGEPSFNVGDPCPESILLTAQEEQKIFPNDFLDHKPLCVIASSDS